MLAEDVYDERGKVQTGLYTPGIVAEALDSSSDATLLFQDVSSVYWTFKCYR